jgi:hypothetical protein
MGPAGTSCTLVDIGNGTGKITCGDITLHVVLASITDVAPEEAVEEYQDEMQLQ